MDEAREAADLVVRGEPQPVVTVTGSLQEVQSVFDSVLGGEVCGRAVLRI